MPAVVALLLVLLVGDKKSASTTAATTGSPQNLQVRKSAQTLEKKLAERRREAKQQGLEDASDLFQKLEQDTKNLADKDDLDHKKALVKLNDLAKDMEKRREKLSGEETLKQQFNQLKNLQQGPADKVAAAFQNGDFKQAAKEVEKLKQQLAGEKLGEKQKQELAGQIDHIRAALEKQAQARAVAKQELEKQLAEARQDGRTDDAQKAQQQLDKLNQECEKCARASALAQQLGEASQALRQGRGQGRPGRPRQDGRPIERAAASRRGIGHARPGARRAGRSQELDGLQELQRPGLRRVPGARPGPNARPGWPQSKSTRPRHR